MTQIGDPFRSKQGEAALAQRFARIGSLSGAGLLAPWLEQVILRRWRGCSSR
jgi:hypothetical protein